MPYIQETFEHLGQALSEVTFVVVDLETTGGSASACEITEIGAVKVRGGQVLGEFQTLVRPASPIPAFIQVLTGITESMVAQAPDIRSVLPAFLDFAEGSVLVAHNARFDVSFLRAATAHCGLDWPGFQVVDTVHLARQLVTRDETPNHKLASLATLFGAVQTPDHRALHDARATVDVLHGLIARVGNLGVTTLEELGSYSSRVAPETRRKRILADDLPTGPGVYLFRDAAGRVLYIGTARNIRRRVRTYFTASEQRRRIVEMVKLAERVTPVVCSTVLEAEVRELRLIAEHQPPYNRRSRNAERLPWVKLSAEAFPRLSLVHAVRDDGATYLGPFSSREAAQSAVDAIHDLVPLRRCTMRISLRPRRAGASAAAPVTACSLAEMGRCGAPCTGQQDHAGYAAVAQTVSDLIQGRDSTILEVLRQRMAALAAQERFEDAQVLRDRMTGLVRTLAKVQRLAPLSRIEELVAAVRAPEGGWELVCVRHGRLAGTTIAPRGADPSPYISAMVAAAETVPPPAPPAPACAPEETDKVLRWLDQPGVRIVSITGELSSPVGGAARLRQELEPLSDTWRDVVAFDEPTRPVRPLHQPPGAIRAAG